jgi:purine-binding chemotaxis protein CheW
VKSALRRRTAQASPAPLGAGVPHLVFLVAGDEYALRLSAVREIVGLGSLAAAASAPPTLRGVLNLRGQRVAVVDLAVAFRGRGDADTPDACVLVLEGPAAEGSVRPAFAVDGVRGLSSVAPEQMAPAPRLGTLLDARVVTALARLDERLVPILELDPLLASPDVRAALDALRDEAVSPGAAR